MHDGNGSPLSKRQKSDRCDVTTADSGGSVAAQHAIQKVQLPSPEQQGCKEKSLHIAPMIRVSNREFRQLMRILSRRCVLWTEMVVDETIYYCSRSKTGGINREKVDVHLDYDQSMEHPIVCQIGGIDPMHSAFTTRMITEDYGYDEVNLNMGCPSDRVSGKEFGAVLMKQADRACELFKSLKQNSGNVPVSVKLRIGVDHDEDFDFLQSLTSRLHEAGCNRFYVHARKVHLKGLNPAQNRIVPPLNYPMVYKLCEEFPDCDFWINGGISGLGAAKAIVFGKEELEGLAQSTTRCEDGKNRSKVPLVCHSVPCALCKYPNGSCIAPLARARIPSNLRGCMLGRAAMDNPAVFWDCDRYFYGEANNPCSTRREVLDKYINYLESVYPRRCCDDRNNVQTNRIPAPAVESTKEYCDICSQWRKLKQHHSPTQKYMVASDSNNLEKTTSNNNTTVSACQTTQKKTKKKKAKITTHVIRRSLRPVLGLFFGLSTSRIFRRRCEELIQDVKIRDCGPAFVLVSALRVVPDRFLDAEFVRTEDLEPSGIVEYVSPQECSS